VGGQEIRLKIAGSHLMNAPRKQVWKYLTDPAIIAKCLPGCEKMEAIGENLYEATLKIGIGAIKGTFASHIRMEVMSPEKQYRLAVEGKGAIGFLNGDGVIALDDSAHSTNVNYEGEVHIGGLIASVGQRMVQGFAKQTTTQFFAAMERELGISASRLETSGLKPET
jgi:carbon monoxide dehydrogenase subunit G